MLGMGVLLLPSRLTLPLPTAKRSRCRGPEWPLFLIRPVPAYLLPCLPTFFSQVGVGNVFGPPRRSPTAVPPRLTYTCPTSPFPSFLFSHPLYPRYASLGQTLAPLTRVGFTVGPLTHQRIALPNPVVPLRLVPSALLV